MSDDKTEPDSGGAAPVGPAAPAPDDKDMTLIAPPKPAKAKKPAKGAKGAKGGKGKGRARARARAGSPGRRSPRIPRHTPRSEPRRAGASGGFAIAAYLSYQAQVPFDQIGLRAIAAGLAGYMVAWAFAVTFWRYLLLAEIRVLAEQQRNPPPTAGGAAGAAQGSPATVAPPGAAD